MAQLLRVCDDGQLELLTRSTGRFRTLVDPQEFPFDAQSLTLDLIERAHTSDEVRLHFGRGDEQFSRAAPAMELTGWRLGDVDLDAELVPGWNGERYSKVRASLRVQRVGIAGLTTIFIPLFASLLIPLLALWMNRPTAEGYEVPAFELANMGVGGLFSVIALSFAVSSEYSAVSVGDNTVTRLFALNYTTLALSLVTVVSLFRFNLVLRFFGPHVNREVFSFLLWALPLLTLATAVAFVLVSAV